jgi:peptidoglycan/LPS O-acetylase OafA/YrhL
MGHERAVFRPFAEIRLPWLLHCSFPLYLVHIPVLIYLIDMLDLHLLLPCFDPNAAPNTPGFATSTAIGNEQSLGPKK